ncbi:hypothetical protein BJ085DRAFT_41390 [Dimargaris cristalligena]|uniref:F-box domain-containing protein n=1 Tax=Dimargaris cristalligena TaxID=215637 RepID=A0A4P9ZWP6_9FUNG|nr:hypothetical protein BJ085DRAFT_41390 [Dimargaris cristalligena]|eukprot:RKP37758.1 hypothetical protein BJ085DRAFT_41390 [Dimargaris cristalligena]
MVSVSIRWWVLATVAGGIVFNLASFAYDEPPKKDMPPTPSTFQSPRRNVRDMPTELLINIMDNLSGGDIHQLEKGLGKGPLLRPYAKRLKKLVIARVGRALEGPDPTRALVDLLRFEVSGIMACQIVSLRYTDLSFAPESDLLQRLLTNVDLQKAYRSDSAKLFTLLQSLKAVDLFQLNPSQWVRAFPILYLAKIGNVGLLARVLTQLFGPAADTESVCGVMLEKGVETHWERLFLKEVMRPPGSLFQGDRGSTRAPLPPPAAGIGTGSTAAPGPWSGMCVGFGQTLIHVILTVLVAHGRVQAADLLIIRLHQLNLSVELSGFLVSLLTTVGYSRAHIETTMAYNMIYARWAAEPQFFEHVVQWFHRQHRNSFLYVDARFMALRLYTDPLEKSLGSKVATVAEASLSAG